MCTLEREQSHNAMQLEHIDKLTSSCGYCIMESVNFLIFKLILHASRQRVTKLVYSTRIIPYQQQKKKKKKKDSNLDLQLPAKVAYVSSSQLL